MDDYGRMVRKMLMLRLGSSLKGLPAMENVELPGFVANDNLSYGFEYLTGKELVTIKDCLYQDVACVEARSAMALQRAEAVAARLGVALKDTVR